MTAWPKWWFHSSRQIWTVELCVIDVSWFPCTRLFLGGNCSVMKGNSFQCKYLIYEECSSRFHYIARLFCLFAYLWLWLPQQILTEQGRSFIKGLGNKDSIELLRHNDIFFPVRKAVFFPRDCDQLGRCYLQLCMPSKKSIKHCECLVSKALFYPEEASCITSLYVLPCSLLVILYILLNLNRHG